MGYTATPYLYDYLKCGFLQCAKGVPTGSTPHLGGTTNDVSSVLSCPGPPPVRHVGASLRQLAALELLRPLPHGLDSANEKSQLVDQQITVQCGRAKKTQVKKLTHLA